MAKLGLGGLLWLLSKNVVLVGLSFWALDALGIDFPAREGLVGGLVGTAVVMLHFRSDFYPQSQRDDS